MRVIKKLEKIFVEVVFLKQGSYLKFNKYRKINIRKSGNL